MRLVLPVGPMTATDRKNHLDVDHGLWTSSTWTENHGCPLWQQGLLFWLSCWCSLTMVSHGTLSIIQATNSNTATLTMWVTSCAIELLAFYICSSLIAKILFSGIQSLLVYLFWSTRYLAFLGLLQQQCVHWITFMRWLKNHQMVLFFLCTRRGCRIWEYTCSSSLLSLHWMRSN